MSGLDFMQFKTPVVPPAFAYISQESHHVYIEGFFFVFIKGKAFQQNVVYTLQLGQRDEKNIGKAIC